MEITLCGSRMWFRVNFTSVVLSSKTLVFIIIIKTKIIVTLIQTKNKTRHSIYHSKFSKCSKFHKNLFQGHGNMEP